MPLHDTSSIPDEPAYWSSLTERVAANALAHRPSVVYWMSATSGIWIAAACLILAVALGLVAQRAASAPTTAVLMVPETPSISALLFSTAR